MSKIFSFFDTFSKIINLLVILTLLAFALFGNFDFINKLLGLKNDNAFEQQIENIIESQVGLDIDLTP